MQSTTTMLREEARVVPLSTAPDQLAGTIDALAGYEQVARRILARNTPAGSAVVRSILGTTVHALDRSAHLGAQNLELRTCRLQAEAAAEAAHRCRQLRAQLT